MPGWRPASTSVVLLVLLPQFALALSRVLAVDAADCPALAATSLPDTELLSAVVVAADGGRPEYCRVRGYVRPAIHFEARLPTRSWNGRFLMSGCGGFCGEVLADRPGYSNGINVALQRGYAAVTTDAGHWGEKTDATWAYHERQAEIDYAYRAIGEVARVGRALVQRFYSQEPGFSYFAGCSNGGRMAAVAAQRFPGLFDGIVSGAPVLRMSAAGAIFGAWLIQANTAPDGSQILGTDRVDLLAQEVLEACDSSDGLADGQVGDPRRCSFDPSALECGAGEPVASCLTAAEVETVRKWYQGPRNSAGEQLYPGVPRGSEPFWPVWLTGIEGSVPGAVALATSYLRYVAFEQDPGPSYAARDFDFDRDPVRLEFMGDLIDADDPDLHAFKAAGGRLLMYHGWADPVVVPEATVDYYEDVIRSMGGYHATVEFFRLFMVPGMGHCWEMPGKGPDRFDPLAALEDWVEGGIPPELIVAESPGEAGEALRSRPLCPYPMVAGWTQEGSIDRAESFDCVMPDF